MKRKTPPTPSPQRSKRRRLSPSSAENEFDESEAIISPLIDISTRINKISPRPTVLLAKQLQSQRIMSENKKKKINLTDDESNIIHEEPHEEEQQHDFDDASTEIARGKHTQITNECDMDLDEDPFAITTDSDMFKAKNTNKNQEDEFQTVPEARNKESESEMYLDLDQELEISEMLLSQQQKQDIAVEYNDNESMNMSLQIQIERDRNLNIPITNPADVIERSMAIEEDEKALELNENTETIAPMIQKKYSVGTRKQKQANTANVLTPITMRLHETLNRRIAPTTKSRRKKRERGRSYSLLDEFERRQMEEYNEEIVDEKKDETLQMILNQSGLSQQWDLIEKQREKKRRQSRKKLAKKNKKKKQKPRKDSEFGVVRPVMSQAVAEEYKEKEGKLADFWREIAEKMENDEFDNVHIVGNDNEINIGGKRAMTPPRIRKHLERRYRKQYENMSNEVVDTGKRKGKKVWFLQQKKEVLNARQSEMLEEENNNSLVSVSDMSEDEDEMGVAAMDGMIDMSLHSVPVMSVGISLMDDMERSEAELESVSVVSGMLLPSIAELSSIMEGAEGEEQGYDDMAMVEDPFNYIVNNDNTVDDDTSIVF